MLSERQIEHLLDKCEGKLKASLTTLRDRLLRDRNHASAIFELVLIYTLLGRFARVEPEAGPGMPDAVLRGRWGIRLSFEAAVVTSRASAARKLGSRFHGRLYREIVALGLPINGANISTEAVAGMEQNAEVPKEHQWREMLRHPSWAEFTSQIRGCGEAGWRCPQGNIVVYFKVRQDGYISAQSLQSERRTDIAKHPVYREIRKKARQIRGWPKRLRARPIVLAICTPGSGQEFWSGYDVDDFSVKRAVFSSLLEHERMSDLDRLNILRQRLKFGPRGTYVESNRLRVAGSKLVSAVLIVRIEQDRDLGLLIPKSRAKPELYLNSFARHPLTDRLMAEIKQLDFNMIEYGPGWENWQGTARDSRKARNIRRGGPFTLRLGKEGDIELRIPSMQILRILAGEATAQEVFGDKAAKSPNPLDVFDKALASELTLESIEVVEGERTSREERQIAFHFGKGKPDVIARAKKRDQME